MAQGPNGWVALGPNGHSKGPPQYRGSSESAMGESQWAKSCSNLRSPTEQCSPSAPQDRGGSTGEVGEGKAREQSSLRGTKRRVNRWNPTWSDHIKARLQRLASITQSETLSVMSARFFTGRPARSGQTASKFRFDSRARVRFSNGAK
jgi:hypothetical protein